MSFGRERESERDEQGCQKLFACLLVFTLSLSKTQSETDRETDSERVQDSEEETAGKKERETCWPLIR